MRRIVRLASAVMILAAGLTVSSGAAEKKCGIVEKVTGPEIIVKYSNVARPLAMGDKLHINTGAGTVNILATFPMQTVSKCRVTGGSASQVKKGMIVYFDIPPVKEEPVVVLPEEKTGIKASDDGTITDTRTGLMWLKNAGSFYGNWNEAVRYCEELEFAGFNDWRLPTMAELTTLSIGVGAENEPWDYLMEGVGFVNVKGEYWTSTQKAADTRYSMAPGSGHIWDQGTNTTSLWTVPVRGTMKSPDIRQFFKDNGDGTITDTRTGLVWMKDAGMAGSQLSWSAAGPWCANLTVPGKGWRLPTREEMMSLWAGLPYGQNIWKKTLAEAGFEHIAKRYWTASDSRAGGRLETKFTVLFDGDITSSSITKGEKYNVWPVKGEGRVFRNRESSFIDSGIDTLTDTRTGLMWLKKAKSVYERWDDVVDYGDDLRFAGFSDWRIATVSDMRSLLAGKPAGVDERFYLLQQGFFGFEKEYWLASEYISNDDSVWRYDIVAGKLRVESPDERNGGGWLVRGGNVDAPDSVGAFEKKGDDILVDIRSGVMWLKNANAAGGPLTLDEAKQFCAKLGAGGFADWRLPTQDEFKVFLSGMNPSKDSRKQFVKQGFTDIQNYYWTSTPEDKDHNWLASTVETHVGSVDRIDKTKKNYVWAVRSEPKKEE